MSGRLTLGEPILGGRQGVASGAPSAMPTGASWGTWGQADASLMAGAVALYPVQNDPVTGTATIALTLTSPATATPRVTGSSALPLTFTSPSTALPRITGTSTLPLTVSTAGSAAARVTGTATVPMTITVASAGGPPTAKLRVVVVSDRTGPRLRITTRGLD
jgi:hypothetical protein